MSKLIVVTGYTTNGDFEFRAKLTLTKPVPGANFAEAKDWVQRLLQPTHKNSSGYTVQWRRDGEIEGYMVPPKERAP